MSQEHDVTVEKLKALAKHLSVAVDNLALARELGILNLATAHKVEEMRSQIIEMEINLSKQIQERIKNV